MIPGSSPFAFDEPVNQTSPSGGRTTLLILLLLVGGAAAFSYIVAYAIPDALVSASVLRPLNAAARPRLLGIAFAGTMAVFLTTALISRVLSQRQFRRIDAMSDEE